MSVVDEKEGKKVEDSVNDNSITVLVKKILRESLQNKENSINDEDVEKASKLMKDNQKEHNEEDKTI